MQPRATFDFESRSACSIKASGTWRYSLDPSTEVLCLAFRLPHWEKGRTGLWHPAHPHLGIEEDGWDDLPEFFNWIEQGELVEAHNAFFERGIWTNICVPTMGWPAIPHRSWRDSAAKAAAHALPRALDDAGAALHLDILKDTEGGKVMKKMASPRKALKSELTAWGRAHSPCERCNAQGKVPGVNPETGRRKQMTCNWCHGRGWTGSASDLPAMPRLYYESAEMHQQLWAYCRVDVLAEEAISESLPDLSDAETEIFLLDQEMNERGFYLDRQAIDTALALIDVEFVELNQELHALTNGEVERSTQRDRLQRWLAANGCELDNMQAETVQEAIDAGGWPEGVQRALEIQKALGKSSTGKVVAMDDWICPDSRVHGGLLYHGASTGRWTGKGVQPHNFPKG